MSWPNRQELLQSFTYEKLYEFRLNRLIELFMDLAKISFILYYCFFGRNLLVEYHGDLRIIWNASVWILPIGSIAWARKSYKNIKYLNDILFEIKRRKNVETTKE